MHLKISNIHGFMVIEFKSIKHMPRPKMTTAYCLICKHIYILSLFRIDSIHDALQKMTLSWTFFPMFAALPKKVVVKN